MTALNFPTSPADGDTFDNYIYDGVREVWRLQPNIPGISSRFKVSATAPENPANGEIWLNSTDGNTYIYYADVDSAQWIEIGGTTGNPPDLDSLNDVTITSPTTGQKLVYDGNNWVNVIDNINSLVDVNITSPVAGQKLVYDGNNWVNLEAYSLVDTLYFTSNGTFTKDDFPWLRAIRVKCQGAGGGGGGVGTFSGLGNSGGGGSGGIAESFITDISGLDGAVSVTRGAGGTGGSGNTTGSTGGDSTFAGLTGNGGVGGRSADGNQIRRQGGVGGEASGGDLNIGGFAGLTSTDFASGMGGGPGGGDIVGGFFDGNDGFGDFGAGGSGAQDNTTISRTGGAGANGIVIIELFA